MLGAQGVVLGTRYCAAPEALYPDWAKKQLVAGGGDETSRSRVFDIARGLDWPSPYTGRAMRNAFVDAWDGREEELRASAEAQEQFALGHRAGSRRGPGLGGEGADLITAVELRRPGSWWPRSSSRPKGCCAEPRQLDH